MLHWKGTFCIQDSKSIPITITTILFWFSIYTATIYIHYNSINNTMHSTQHCWVNITCHSLTCLWVCSKCIFGKKFKSNIMPNKIMYVLNYTKYILHATPSVLKFSHISLKKHAPKKHVQVLSDLQWFWWAIAVCYRQKRTNNMHMNIGICWV